MTTARDPRLRMSEAQLEEHVRCICHDVGVIYVHQRDSRGTTKGLPDDLLIGPGGLLFRELKRQDGKVSPEQAAMHAALAEAGADVATWRPSDLISGDIAWQITAISRLGPVARRKKIDEMTARVVVSAAPHPTHHRSAP